MKPHRAWAAQWRSRNKADGLTEFLLCRGCVPMLFHTRADARRWILETYGYLDLWSDLRREPHGWRMPRAVRVTIQIGGDK